MSDGNPRTYAKRGTEQRANEEAESRRREIEAWVAQFDMTVEEYFLYEQTMLPRVIRDYQGFDENEYYSILADEYNNSNYDTERESESVGRGCEVLQGEQSVPARGTEPIGAGNEGGAVSSDVQGGIEEGTAREEAEVELDENGRPFVVSSDGTTSFGEIREESGLPAAPIKLSEGYQDKNGKGYGLIHIEANHGEQIRNAGFASVEEFVSFVAKNYDEDNIRVGKRRDNLQSTTYLIQVTDKHDNTLFIELSRDGSYWNVNSGGIFRKGYSNKKETVAKTEPQQPNNAVSTGSSLSAEDKSGISATEPNGEPTVSTSENSAPESNVQEKSQKSGENSQIAQSNGENRTNPTGNAQIVEEISVDGGPTISQESEQVSDQVGPFGTIYTQFKNKFEEAFDFLVREGSGDATAVFEHSDIGEIDLVWGDEKGGLRHIIEKHTGEGKSFATHDDAKSSIVDILKNGDVVFSNGDKVVIKKGDKLVTLRKNVREKGKKIADKNWVLTAYDETKADGTSAISDTNKGQAARPADVSAGKDSNTSDKKQITEQIAEDKKKLSVYANRDLKQHIRDIERALPKLTYNAAHASEQDFEKADNELRKWQIRLAAAKELLEERDNGDWKSKFGVKLSYNKNLAIEDVKTLFDSLNEDKAVNELFEKVYKVAKQLGLKIKISDQLSTAMGSAGTDGIVKYAAALFYVPHTNQSRATVLLHELIHTTTMYATALHGLRNRGGVLTDMYNGLPQEIKDACAELERIYNLIKDNKAVAGEYGITSVNEMVAELANVEFRAKMKKIGLWERLVNAVKRLFDFPIKTDAEQRVSDALSEAERVLDTMLENFDMTTYNAIIEKLKAAGLGRKRRLSPFAELQQSALSIDRESPEFERATARTVEQAKSILPVEIATPEQARAMGGEAQMIAEANERFNSELQQQIDGTLPKGHIYQLGMPSAVLKSIGIPNLPIQLNSTKLQEKATRYGHDYNLEEIKDLVKALNEPLAVFAYGDETKAQNIVVEIQSNGKNFVVGLALRPVVGGRALEINSIRNVFPKDNAEWLNWISQGKALYLDKEKIQTLINQQRTNLADVGYLDLDSIANIINNFKNKPIKPDFSRVAAPFYSNAKKAVLDIKQEKATPEQWVAMLKKNGGLKAGEDAWVGLEDWLNERAKSKDERGKTDPSVAGDSSPKTGAQMTVTKQEIIDYIDENSIQIEEVEYGANPNSFETLKKEYESLVRNEGFDAVQEVMLDRFGDDFSIAFDDWGGELVITDEGAAASLLGSGNIINSTRLDYTTRGLNNKREIALVVPTIEPWNESDDIHFGDAGGGRAVAWVRFGETTDGEGNRVLVIDEIQSKRHQYGREKGYVSASEEKRKALREYRDSLLQKYNTRRLRDVKAQATTEELQRLDELDKAIIGVPSAPFEKNWHELAMKRMLRLAAEEGFDKVAWTTGEQQADRYDMSNQIESITAEENAIEEFSDGTPVAKNFTLETTTGMDIRIDVDTDGVVHGGEYGGKALSEIVGKELAEKMMQPGSFTLEGENLKIGGEGMKGFYDRMLPSFVQKYTKKWGASVGTVEMPSLEQNNVMHSVDVTPAMRESVMQGQPMFMRTSNGTLYGWAVNGKIYLTPDGLNPDTPVHEYTHLWASAVEKNNPEQWARIVDGLKASLVWNEVLLDENYRDIWGNENRVASEVLSRLSGRENYNREMERAREEIKGAQNVIDAAEKISLRERVKQALSDFWNKVKSLVGLPVKGEPKSDVPSWVEFVEMPLKDFWAGVKPAEVEGAPAEKMFIGEQQTDEDDVLYRTKETAPETASVRDEHQPTVVSSADGAKVLKDLDNAIIEYENKSSHPKTLLGDIAKVLGAKKHGSNSQYATFEAVNGKVFTIRLANHNATVSTFDNHDENEGISIVVTAQGNNGITNDGNAHIVEFFYDAIKLRKADGKPLVEILKSIKQALYSGEYRDTTGLAIREEVNSDILSREGYGPLADSEVATESDVYAKALGRPRYTGRKMREYVVGQRQKMAERVERLAEKLHLSLPSADGSAAPLQRSGAVEIVTDASTLEGKKQRAKGFYTKSTGKITVVIPNHSSVADVEQTLLHEAVAHYGLRQLFGESFDTFLDNVYYNASEEVREEIDRLAMEKYDGETRTATEEYLASLAENTNFENAERSSWWQKIKRFFVDMLAKAGVKLDAPLTDNELRYILWRSYENLAEPGRYRSIIGEAADIAKQYNLGVGNYAPVQASGDMVAERDVLNREGTPATGEFINASVVASNWGNTHKGAAPCIVIQSAETLRAQLEQAGFSAEDIADAEKIMNNGATGGYNPNADKVVIFKNDLSKKELRLTLWHENAHRAIEKLYTQEEIERVFKAIVGEYEQEVREVLAKIGYKVEDQAEEFLVQAFEYLLYDAKTRTMLEGGKFKAGEGATDESKILAEFIKPIIKYINNGGEGGYNPDGGIRESVRENQGGYVGQHQESLEVRNSGNESGDTRKGIKARRGTGDPVIHERALAQRKYEERVKSGMFQSQEALQDSMLSLKVAMQEIVGKDVYIEDIAGFENAYLGENRLSSVNKAEADRIVELFNRLMTQVKNERLRLREQNHFLDLLVKVSPMGVVILDSKERVTLMNPAACKFLAVEGDCTDKPLWQIKSELLAEIAKIEPEQQGVVRLNGANIFHCSRLSFLDRGYRRPFIIIEPLTDEIHKAERSAYEKVIRMIAHEVNNSVGGITATLNVVSDAISSVSKAGADGDASDILQVIKVCEERSYNLSRFITGFANVVKIPAPTLQRVGINDCVTHCIRFMQHMCQEKGIELRTTLIGEDVSVNADVLLFEQVMVNIVKNSVESIVDGGVITISTSGSPAQIIVTDNGSGVAKGNEGLLFTPFFSTKANGRGLGLMFIREILTAHGCSFSLKTGDDGLTRFVISFA